MAWRTGKSPVWNVVLLGHRRDLPVSRGSSFARSCYSAWHDDRHVDACDRGHHYVVRMHRLDTLGIPGYRRNAHVRRRQTHGQLESAGAHVGGLCLRSTGLCQWLYQRRLTCLVLYGPGSLPARLVWCSPSPIPHPLPRDCLSGADSLCFWPDRLYADSRADHAQPDNYLLYFGGTAGLHVYAYQHDPLSPYVAFRKH